MTSGRLIRRVLPYVILAVNATVYLELHRPARILAVIMVALFVVLFLIEARQAGIAPSSR